MRAQASGGIFEGAEVTYRGVTVGRVGPIDLRGDGIRVRLDLETEERIPARLRAVVANGSAVGEQFVDLQPETADGPWLEDGSVIAGLYATGNSTAPVVGRTYPGAGASISPSFVFGWVTARHAMGQTIN